MKKIAAVVLLIAGLAVPLSAASASAAATASPHGGARQVYATGLKPGAPTKLLNGAGHVVAKHAADSLGGIVFRDVKPGSGYRVVQAGEKSAAVTVHPDTDKPWNPSVYNQTIPDHGYGYLTTRDGTKLAYYVHPPTSPAGLGLPDVTLPPGIPDYAPPYPTLIEYAGYGYANPAGPESGIAILANLMGFAVVDVNMRGTGCSAGSFNFFERMQSLDGYDIVETVARQPWVKGHKVGMEGISYGGISQLFTGQTNPPSLAAIAPLSVIDATATTLEPGGILNDGFAVAWANERQYQARPAGKDGGQAWAYKQIQSGDKVCKANQVLHGEAQDLPATIAANTHYHPSYADTLDPLTFVHKIHVPTFMACQFEDEQTGGHCMNLAQHFTGTKEKWFTFTNGVHTDSLDPDTFNRWYDFLELYVAKQAPLLNSAVIKAAAPVVYQMALGLPQSAIVTLPVDPIQLEPTYAAALADFKAQPSIRVNFDNGAGTDPLGQYVAGDPYYGFSKNFSKFPIPNTLAQRWFFGPSGSLTEKRAGSGVDKYTSDPYAVPLNDFIGSTGGGGLWGNASQWHWNWKHNPSGTAVSYVTPPLKTDTTVVGAGSIHVWVKSSRRDVDLQATVSEVTPDNNEVFVQGGWMRASERKLDTRKHTIFAQPSTLLAPVPSFREADSRPMPKGKYVKVVIPLYYEGHAYRAGSRIRITIAAPNGAQPIWSFQHPLPEKGKTTNVAISFSKSRPSALFLPVIPGVSVPTGLPECGSLRNEPCRPYAKTANQKG